MVALHFAAGARLGARISRLALAALAICAAWTAPAAATDDVFVVARVPVQARAESATAAKGEAQAAGRRRAMDILLRRVTPEPDWVYLPRLSTGEPAQAVGASPIVGSPQPIGAQQTIGAQQAAGAPEGKSAIAISEDALVNLEQSFEVYDEKSSPQTYRALITYRFKPDAVRGLLKRSKIPYSEAQTRMALVLPVLETDNGVYLWEGNNPWMAAWKARPYTHELTPMIAPEGDVDDSAAISARGALDLDPEGLAQLAERYAVSQIIVAHARLKQEDGLNRVRVQLLNGYRETGKAAGRTDAQSPSSGAEPWDDGRAYDPAQETRIPGSNPPIGDVDGLDVDGLGAGAADDGFEPMTDDAPGDKAFDAPAYTPAMDDDFAATVGEVLAVASLEEEAGDFPALAERLIEDAIAKYASGWKTKTLIDHGAEALLAATAFFDTIQDWTRIRNALIATPLVGAVQISALSQRGAEMNLRVFGDPSRLQVAMENQGVVFWTETGERWFLARPDTASRYRGQRFLQERTRRGFGRRRSRADAESALRSTPPSELEPRRAFEPQSADVDTINLKDLEP